jgi:N-acetylated-alpha-linked acidic dipeptidase
MFLNLHPLTLTPQYGLIGSTEWAEDFPNFIDKHVAAYLNLGVSCPASIF